MFPQSIVFTQPIFFSGFVSPTDLSENSIFLLIPSKHFSRIYLFIYLNKTRQDKI